MGIRKIFSFATLTLLVALTLSGIAAWYSIQGLMAIFAAAVIPIAIMGGSLEIAKVVTTVWLHRYWDKAKWNLKIYLVPAVVALAFLTSMGIFGFLSKAHSDQSLVSGDVSAKIELVDEKIKIARDNIALNRQALSQMNSQVDQLLGRTDDEQGANRAVQVRRQQARERARLNREIAREQTTIQRLNEEAAPIRAEIRKVEAEVGPIKYIAALIYGDNPDSNLLERAVRWVIILIVFVFDPLALALVIAAQNSYRWLDEDLLNQNDDNEDVHVTKGDVDHDHSGEVDESLDEEPDTFVEAFNEVKGSVDSDLDLLYETSDDDEILYQSTPSPIEIKEPLIVEETKEEPTIVEKDIQTDGVTLTESDSGYVQYSGKSVNKDALREMHPELFLKPDDITNINSSFGISFPKIARKGDTFVRVDILPNRVFKFSGTKWIEINKEQTNTYLYDIEYVKYLVEKIVTGEYDIELLTEQEKIQIEEYLQSIKE